MITKKSEVALAILVSALAVPALLMPVARVQADARPPERAVDAPHLTAEELSAGDWSSIHAAVDAHRHAAVGVAGGFVARNPGQQWQLRFDGRAFLAIPDSAAWTWGLELVSYGRAGAESAIDHPICIDAQGGRVRYEWDARLTEWYVNDRRGLEHGLTLREQPPPADSEDGSPVPLRLTFTVRGGLRPEVDPEGRDVNFVDEQGDARVRYQGLLVIDADGRPVPSRFDLTAPALSLQLTIDDRDARYPLTIDPIAQEAYFKASRTGPQDAFGWSVAMSGDTVVIGAWGEDSNAAGVNGDQTNNSAIDSGAAYIFVRNGSTWTQQAYLKASNPGPADEFGIDVGISGDTVVIASHGEDSAAIGVNGNQQDESLFGAGAAYVFVREGGTWSQQAYLKSSNNLPGPDGLGDAFGDSVAISGDLIVVTAPAEDSSATGVNGDPFDDGADHAGAAYVFERRGTTWTQQAYLKASNTDEDDLFGWSIGISGETVVVGAIAEKSAATGVDGNQSDDSASDAGAAYVFARVDGEWSQQAYLKASNSQAGDQFGLLCAADGDTIVVTAHGEDSSATGVDGDQSNNGASGSGAAYVFVRSGTTWSQQAYLKASNPWMQDIFGTAVAISGNVIVVGARYEDSNATGVDGNQANNDAENAGAAYLFLRTGALWSPLAYLKASNTGAMDEFGAAAAVFGNTVLVGAPYEDSKSVGINGDQGNNLAPNSGAVYVYDLGLAPACPGDLDGDGQVGGRDITIVLGEWGSTGAPGIPGDVDLDGVVDEGDISAILAGWGLCPLSMNAG